MKKRSVLGFIQEVGLTAPAESDVVKIIAAELLDADERKNCEVKIECVGVIREDDLQREVFEDEELQGCVIGDPLALGIWYRSGRGYYS